jgi:hypothetical protein
MTPGIVYPVAWVTYLASRYLENVVEERAA